MCLPAGNRTTEAKKTINSTFSLIPKEKRSHEQMTSPAVLMKAWKLYPKKQLGQNFLADANMAAAIVAHGGVAS